MSGRTTYAGDTPRAAEGTLAGEAAGATALRALLPIAVGLVVYGAALGWLGGAAARRAEGPFTYALDDPYIHMALARTLAEDGTLGVAPGSFAPASSSLLWTALLAAGFGVAGVRELLPFVLNVASGVALIALAGLALACAGVGALAASALLAALVIATPLPLLAYAGMEHTLQLALDLALVLGAARWLASERACAPAALLVLAPLVVAIRYEGAFLVGFVALFAVLRGRLRAALALLALGAAPALVYGVWAVAQGGLFLPNPVLLKAKSLGGIAQGTGAGALLSWSLRGLRAITGAPHLAVSLLACLAIALVHVVRGPGLWRAAPLACALVAATGLAHAQLAGLGWLYRYESYLVGMALVTAAIGLVAALRDAAPGLSLRIARCVIALAILAVAGWPVLDRAASAWIATPRAVANIWEQQRQMARFVASEGQGRAVAANDIGAIAFYAPRSPLLDLAGLASNDVARLRMERRFDREAMGRLVREHGVSWVLIYDTWFERFGIPEGWQRVGRWTIRDRVAASHDTVSFYGVDEASSAALADALGRFAAQLPRTVRQRGGWPGAEPDDAPPAAAVPNAGSETVLP